MENSDEMKKKDQKVGTRDRGKQKKTQYPYVPKGNPLELPPCKICNGKASGIHYGVNSCEACKGFFRRFLLRKEPYKCLFGGNCEISDKHRGNCSACRMQKCLTLGMSKEGIRQGRYTLTERTKAILEVKKLQGKDEPSPDVSQDSLLNENLDFISITESENSPEKSLSVLSSSSSNLLSCSQFTVISPDPDRQKTPSASSDLSDEQCISPENIDFSIIMSESMQQNLSNMLENQYLSDSPISLEKLDPPPEGHLFNAVSSSPKRADGAEVVPAPPVSCSEESYDDYVEALVAALNNMRPHSSQMTNEEIKNLLQEGYDKYKLKTDLFGPLNALSPEEYNDIYERTNLDVDGRKQHLLRNKETLEGIIKQYVNFSHVIQGFSDLPVNDQATLLKASRFEFFMLLEYRSLDPDLEMVLTYTGEVFHLNEACMYVPKEMMKSWLEFTRNIKKLQLTAKELAVTLAIALTFRDRCTLEDADQVESIQTRLINVLQHLLKRHHGDKHVHWFTKIMDIFIAFRGLTAGYLDQYKKMCEDKFLIQHLPEVLEFLFDE